MIKNIRKGWTIFSYYFIYFFNQFLLVNLGQYDKLESKVRAFVAVVMMDERKLT